MILVVVAMSLQGLAHRYAGKPEIIHFRSGLLPACAKIEVFRSSGCRQGGYLHVVLRKEGFKRLQDCTGNALTAIFGVHVIQQDPPLDIASPDTGEVQIWGSGNEHRGA